MSLSTITKKFEGLESKQVITAWKVVRPKMQLREKQYSAFSTAVKLEQEISGWTPAFVGGKVRKCNTWLQSEKGSPLPVRELQQATVSTRYSFPHFTFYTHLSQFACVKRALWILLAGGKLKSARRALKRSGFYSERVKSYYVTTDNYEAGFHCFKTLDGVVKALTTLQEWESDECTPLMILPCKCTDLVCEGTQYDQEVIVARQNYVFNTPEIPEPVLEDVPEEVLEGTWKVEQPELMVS